MRENQAGRFYIRSSFAVAALAVVFVLHLVFTQFVALESENEAAVSELLNQPAAGVELISESEAKKPDEAMQQQTSVSPVIRANSVEENESRVIAARQRVEVKQPVAAAEVKKKEPRGSRSKTERLRRAEKILTGI